MLKNNKLSKSFMVMGMVAILSVPLLNTNLSSRCNSLAGAASVSKTVDLVSTSANNSQNFFCFFQYVGDPMESFFVYAYRSIMGKGDGPSHSSIPTNISLQQEVKVLLQELN